MLCLLLAWCAAAGAYVSHNSLCPQRDYSKTNVRCEKATCTSSSRRDYLCRAADAAVNLRTGTIALTGCSGSVEYEDRFQKAVPVRFVETPERCTHSCDTALYFAAGMLDEWNPYEGLHQHVVAFATLLALGLESDTVIFQGEISRSRGFPLLGMWENTFKHVVYGTDAVVCTRRLVIPPSAERSLNTFHQPTCDDPHIAAEYRNWVLSSTTPIQSDVLVAVRESGLRRHELNMGAFLSHLSATLPTTNITAHVMHRIPFATQLAMVSGTKVYVGTHGASLAHLYALPRCAQVVELFSQPHYKFMAKLWRVSYHSVEVGIAWGTSSYNIPVARVSDAVSVALADYGKCMRGHRDV